MALPTINTYFVNQEKIALYWKASPKSNIIKWNVYGTPAVTISFIPPDNGVVLDGGLTPANAFVKILDGVANRDIPLTPGSVYVEFTRAELGIGPTDPYYFALTSVDNNNVESAIEIPNVQGIPLADDYFVDEAGQPINVVYKNFEFDLWPMGDWDIDRYLDIESLLGRPAKQIKVDAIGDNFWMKINSFSSDSISIRYSSPGFQLLRGELLINKIWLNNPTTNDVTVRIFLAA